MESLFYLFRIIIIIIQSETLSTKTRYMKSLHENKYPYK